jgi:ribonucleotide reductase beta subunit family protein with ferritin-like domain
MQIKANFFENRVSSYQKAGVGNKQEDMNFSVDEAF